LHAQGILNQLHLMTYRRMGEAEFVRSIADALAAGRSLKAFQRLERRQLPKIDFGLTHLASPLFKGRFMPSARGGNW
jgi:hypothetical protein